MSSNKYEYERKLDSAEHYRDQVFADRHFLSQHPSFVNHKPLVQLYRDTPYQQTNIAQDGS